MRQSAPKYVSWILLSAAAMLLLPQAALAGKKVLRVVFDGPVLEAPDDNAQLFAILGGSDARTLRDWVNLIEEATEDSEVAGMAMIVERPQFGFAQLEEVSRALKAFRDSGKKIYCYMDHAGNGGYALGCAADHITLAEFSELGIIGLHAELSFYKGLLDKIGVEADMIHCGAYKAALEPYTRTEPSPEFAENINWLLDGIFERWVGMIAESRGLSADEVKALVDRAPVKAEDALEHKLVDQVSSFPDFKKMIYKEFGKDVQVVKKLEEDSELEIDFENPFAMFQMFAERFSELMDEASEPAQPSIALIYIEGSIMVGKNDSNPFSGSVAGSTTIRAAFEKAREDDNVKAVVVRVNSPGGSALASDIMWEAATRCGQEKPVVVSMGNVAGSGGYYVSIPGDTIFAEETTITASIGVVGGKMVWDGLMKDKLGITTTEIDRGKHAGLWSMNQRWTEAERAWVTEYMNSTYEQFKGRIMGSRGDRIKGNLEDMAGGRVYTGRQALERGLVDRIGGLSEAIEYIAKKVGLDDYDVHTLPEPLDFGDFLAMLMEEDIEDEWEISLASGGVTSDPLLRAARPLLQSLAPQQLRKIARSLQHLVTLNQEHVGCFMPAGLTIR